MLILRKKTKIKHYKDTPTRKKKLKKKPQQRNKKNPETKKHTWKGRLESIFHHVFWQLANCAGNCRTFAKWNSL